MAHPPAPQAVPAGREPDPAGRALRTLRRRIVSGDLPPGAPLREEGLAQELGVSRSRLREALAQLEFLGLVDRTPNRGAFVHRLTLSEAREVFEARGALEGMCAGLAAQRADPASWQDLLDQFNTTTAALVEAGDLEGYLAQLEVVRRRVIAAAGNRTIRSLLRPLLDRSAVPMRRVVLATNRASEGLLQNLAVLEALRAGDAATAERLKRAQLHAAWLELERYHRLIL